jgi:hypothetical protein
MGRILKVLSAATLMVVLLAKGVAVFEEGLRNSTS